MRQNCITHCFKMKMNDKKPSKFKFHFPRAGAKHERLKMKRDACKKRSPSLRKRLNFWWACLFIFGCSYFIRTLVACPRLKKLPAKGDNQVYPITDPDRQRDV